MSAFGKLFRAAAATAATAITATAGFAQTPQPYIDPATAERLAFLRAAQYTPPGEVVPTGGGGGFGLFNRPSGQCCPPTAPYYPGYPGGPSYLPPGMPGAPGTPGMPGSPGTPGSPTTPPGMPPTPNTPDAAPNLPNLSAGADAGAVAGLGGYIDNAVPVTMFRLRYDAAYGNNRPDRAEFFYAKCGCFATPAGGNQLDAHGPPQLETNVDYQELTPYFEYALTNRFSMFANIPIRFINPEQNANSAGFSDLSFGAKYAFIYGPQRVVSGQLRVQTPTGNTNLGLGTGVTWLEPGILWQEQVSPVWQVFGQLKDQIPLDRQSDFTGNILTYGLGTSYMVAKGCWGYVAPVGEVVGWTVLSGKELIVEGPAAAPVTAVKSAAGDSIVNGKVGVRIGFGAPSVGSPYPTNSDLYIGYGRALTGEVWYKNMFRVEYRRFF